MLRRLGPPCLLAAALMVLGTPAAWADTVGSSNWAGYAAHGGGVRFTRVTGSWRQPSVRCNAGRSSYSSFWVGLGGYGNGSRALEQIGTEVDCTAGGAVRSTAWYELVPAASQPVSLTVRPGDLLIAGVSASGRRVTLTLLDETTGQDFSRTLTARALDLTSAEWIAEAPSDCLGGTYCQTLPLANFGSAVFSGASVQTRGGTTGGIAGAAWRTTRIELLPGGRRFNTGRSGPARIQAAVPSRLRAQGSAFAVTYAKVAERPMVATHMVGPRAGGLMRR